jgi:uncharacterized protein YbbC (DUF1343 family)
MQLLKPFSTLFFILSLVLPCISQSIVSVDNPIKTLKDIRPGAYQTYEYLPILMNKRVALVANQSSMIGERHLVDTLLNLKVNVKKVFCPEHGFRGLVDAGKLVGNDKDEKTGLPLITLYGKNKKPSVVDLKDIDVVIFDIQDVGVRFYTYISTLHYVMEACAENNIQLVVFDRPNPNGHYIDGPVLEPAYKSFLGMHPVPIVYGLTIGEYATMINGEQWLANKVKCKLTVVKLIAYTHKDLYQLPVKPSPNLPNMASVYLYPSLGLFEGTVVSVGRGTDLPFQCIGNPLLKNTPFKFTPQAKPGAMEPKYKGELCYGYNLQDFGNEYMKSYRKIYLYWLMNMYKNYPNATVFFDENFNYHAGNALLQKQITGGATEDAIRQSWSEGLVKYKVIRKKYLLYKDFE